MCVEEGSSPGAPLAVVCNGFPEILPHRAVRLRHEGAVNERRDQVLSQDLFITMDGVEMAAVPPGAE